MKRPRRDDFEKLTSWNREEAYANAMANYASELEDRLQKSREQLAKIAAYGRVLPKQDCIDIALAAINDIWDKYGDERAEDDPKCSNCGKTEAEVGKLEWGANPYESDLHDDKTPCWLCDGCSTELAQAL